jgi:hypothetical protein
VSKPSKRGRGHPPVGRQFDCGQKRAAGRPQGAVGEKTLARSIAAELHQVQHNGRTVELNTIEVLLLSMRNLAMSGHLQAAKWLSDYRAQVLPDAGAQGGYLVVPEIMPTEQYTEREMFLNKFRTHPELREDPLIASTYTRDKK